MKSIKVILCLIGALIFLPSCSTTVAIPSGVWICEEEDISLFVASTEHIALYKGHISVVRIGYCSDMSFESLPAEPDDSGLQYLGGDYELIDNNTLIFTTMDSQATTYTFTRKKIEADDIKGKWKSADLSFPITDSAVTIGTTSDNTPVKVLRTPDAPYIWCIDPSLSYSQKGLLFFGKFSLEKDILLLDSFYDHETIQFQKDFNSAANTTTG